MVVTMAGCDEKDGENGKTTATTKGGNSSSKDDIPISQKPSGDTLTKVEVDSLETENMFSNRDTSGEYDESEAAAVALNGDSAKTSAKGVSLENGVLKISNGGVYILSGNFDGQILIDAKDTEKIQLVLGGAKINADKKAAIYVKSADKLFITTVKDTENKISCTGEISADGETNVDGAVFSKCDVSVNGNGSLEVICENGHGIVSKDDLTVGGGKLSVNSSNHGLNGKDSVRIAGGEISIDCGKDGIHSENTEDSTKGFVYIENGSFAVSSVGDGISASAIVQISGGDFTIKTSGTGETSAKGIKAGTSVILTGGSFKITATDDGIHSSMNTVIDGAEAVINSGDDGIHSDNNVSVNSGKLEIAKSYEGVEGQTVNFTGGDITIVSSDDGVNAAGGSDEENGFGGHGGDKFFGGGKDENTEGGYINISGGNITVQAEGDGLDTNGTIYVSGGVTMIFGPSNGGNGSLDYGKSAEITGGTVFAAGARGMAQNFAQASQGSFLTDTSLSSGEIVIKNSQGEEIFSCEPTVNYSCLLFSSPEITEGETYTVSAGGNEYTIEMTSVIVGNGGGFGGGMGGGNRPQRPDRDFTQIPENFDISEIPDDMPQDFGIGEKPSDFIPDDIPKGFNPSDIVNEDETNGASV